METVINLIVKNLTMTKSPEEVYSDSAQQFAEKWSIDNITDELARMLEEFVDLVEDGRVLDAGCGHGRDVEYFVENGLEAVGIDKAEGMIEHAKQNKKG